MLRRGFLTPCPASPAVEVHLIAPQVNIAIGEHSADFFKELGHEGIGGVQDGVHRSKGARKLWSGVTRCEQIFLTWRRTRGKADEFMMSETLQHFECVKTHLCPKTECVRACQTLPQHEYPSDGQIQSPSSRQQAYIHVCTGGMLPISTWKATKKQINPHDMWNKENLKEQKNKHAPAGLAVGMFCSCKERMVRPQCASGRRLFYSLPWFPV